MSADTPIGLAIIEKLLGLVLIIVGAIVAFYSTNSLSADISQFSGIFTTIGVVVIAVGVMLIIAKTK